MTDYVPVTDYAVLRSVGASLLQRLEHKRLHGECPLQTDYVIRNPYGHGWSRRVTSRRHISQLLLCRQT